MDAQGVERRRRVHNDADVGPEGAEAVVVLGDRNGVTGAAVAILVSTLVFASAWVVILVRLRDELRTSGGVAEPRAASS